MKESELLKKAKNIISSVSGKHLTTEERKTYAIELAALMLTEAKRIQTSDEREIQAQLARMMNDANGKSFTTSMTDQCFRSKHPKRVADQLVYLIKKFGTPSFLSFSKRMQMLAFKTFGKLLPSLFVPLTKNMLRKETSTVILPGEPNKLANHMHKRQEEGVRINLNHLGEAILGEEEAKHRLEIYLDDLAKPEVEYISVKISTICSQINLLAWEDSLEILAHRLKRLYRTAKNYKYQLPNGTQIPKFVNLDMEEYRDLHLTVALFKKVLEDPDFYDYSAGIVLQSYLPDSFLFQQELTVWAMQRVANGGAPIKIRIVKGANLAMEQVEASLRNWPQAPYESKAEVDANYKRMITYGCEPLHAKASHIGIGSHNLFDIAYALLLRSENQVEKYVCFEMLEGMADPMRRVVQELAGDMLLYCPAATREEFQNAVAYLVRRLDENTAPENFLRHAFDMTPGTEEWLNQAKLFSNACEAATNADFTPRRIQNRLSPPIKPDPESPFENEPDTDWSLPQNRKWGEEILRKWSQKRIPPIPLVIAGETISSNKNAGSGIGEDPFYPGIPYYHYALANSNQVNNALNSAEQASKQWQKTAIEERSRLLSEAAQLMRIHRGDLIGAMVADTGKTIPEADVEVSEAIDFAEYYRRHIEECSYLEGIQWRPKGIVLVTPPWNFPCSIAAGGILVALAAGNCVIFKPAPESVLVGWELVQLLWRAGISKEVLQFITCDDDTIGSQLIQDPRISTVILTGATATAKKFLKMRPGIDLMAETGGKNAIIVTDISDRDLAIKDIIHSAFGHSGQKCSACSLVICEAAIYDDPSFRKHLCDAAASLHVGSAWNPASRITPLIRAPNPVLMQGLTQLEEGEEWLLQPKQDPKNPHLWSPGIKLGVKPGSFSHQNEFFGPLIGIMRARDLEEAIEFANGTSYGLTSGLQSLDEREQNYWMHHIEAGNCYINRGITGAIVQRQPFGGCKESSFGRGAKAGGPNYVMQLRVAEEIKDSSLLQETPPENIQKFTRVIEQANLSPETINLWNVSIGSYTFYYQHYFSQDQDLVHVLGQDNILRYKPQPLMVLRIQTSDRLIDVLRVMAAAALCGTKLMISYDSFQCHAEFLQTPWLKDHEINFIEDETEEAFIHRLNSGDIQRIRLISKPAKELLEALADAACTVLQGPVLANGRLELLNYLREVCFSIDYHRYGNLGEREGEKINRQQNRIKQGCGTQCKCV